MGRLFEILPPEESKKKDHPYLMFCIRLARYLFDPLNVAIICLTILALSK